MPDYAEHYEELETSLQSLLTALTPELSSKEREELLSFLKAREYGLVLETIVEIILEKDVDVDDEISAQISEIARRMQISESPTLISFYDFYERHTGSHLGM